MKLAIFIGVALLCYALIELNNFLMGDYRPCSNCGSRRTVRDNDLIFDLNSGKVTNHPHRFCKQCKTREYLEKVPPGETRLTLAARCQCGSSLPIQGPNVHICA